MARRNATRSARVTRRRPRAARIAAGVDQVVTRYIESSALVAALLEFDEAARASLRAAGRRVTSALTLAETARAVVRARMTGRLTPQQARSAGRALQVFARRSDLVAVTDSILERAGRPFPVEPIRTLDAIHLATAELLDNSQPLTIVVRDDRVRANALALGYVVE